MFWNADSLAAALAKGDSTTQDVSLCNQRLGADGWGKVFSALAGNTSCKYLRLTASDLTDQNTGALADSLRLNRTLEYLYLPSTQITDDGAKILACGLSENKGLGFLGLHGCKQITNDGAAALRDVVSHARSLRGIDLFASGVSGAMQSEVAAALRTPKVVKVKDFVVTLDCTFEGDDLHVQCVRPNGDIAAAFHAKEDATLAWLRDQVCGVAGDRDEWKVIAVLHDGQLLEGLFVDRHGTMVKDVRQYLSPTSVSTTHAAPPSTSAPRAMQPLQEAPSTSSSVCFAALGKICGRVAKKTATTPSAPSAAACSQGAVDGTT